MNKFKLKLRNRPESSYYWFNQIGEILSLKRKFRTIQLQTDRVPRNLHNLGGVYYDNRKRHETLSAIMRVAAQHGSEVRKLILNRVQLYSNVDFEAIGNNMPLMEELEVKYSLPIDDSDENFHYYSGTSHLESLKHVKVISSDTTIFRFFTAPHIESLQLINPMLEPGYPLTMLLTSDKLESLEIDTSFKFFKYTPSTIKLKKLSIHSLVEPPRVVDYSLFQHDEAELIKFLESQAPTLIHLELEGAYRIEVYQTILTKLNHLKILKVNFKHLPVDKKFYADLKPLMGLKELHSFSDHPAMAKVVGMCGRCPNIESFTSPCAGLQLLPFLVRNNPLLKVLSVPCVSSSGDVKFEHLKVLKVPQLSVECIKMFFANNPTVDTLGSFYNENVTSIEEVEAVLSIPTLKHLKLRGDFRSLRKIYELTKVDFRNLKSLRLQLRDEKFELKNLLIEAPDIVGHWKPTCDFFDDRTSDGAPHKTEREEEAEYILGLLESVEQANNQAAQNIRTSQSRANNLETFMKFFNRK